MYAQCGNYGNSLSRIFGKNFVKATVLLNTVNALLVPAGTIFFKPLEVRGLFKRGHYSRAGTIEKSSEFEPKMTKYRDFLELFKGKMAFFCLKCTKCGY